MRYFFLYFIALTVISFLIQSILCRKVKKGILRHGTLIFSIIFIVFQTVILFTQCGDIFGGLSVIAAVFWFVNACCTVMGYGIAWFVFLIMKKGKNRKLRDGGGL